MRWRRLGGGALLGLVLLLAGCTEIGSALVLFGPRRIQKTQFELTKGRLVILIEAARRGEDNPVFAQALHEKLVEIFRQRKVNDQVVPRADLVRLLRSQPDSARWNLQRVGRALHAEQVLYIRVERLQLSAGPDHLLIEPQVELRVKVIGVHQPPHTERLWPGRDEREGHPVERKRQMREAGDAMILDTEAAKLGKDAAQMVAMPFYDVDLEENIPWEP